MIFLCYACNIRFQMLTERQAMYHAQVHAPSKASRILRIEICIEDPEGGNLQHVLKTLRNVTHTKDSQ